MLIILQTDVAPIISEDCWKELWLFNYNLAEHFEKKIEHLLVGRSSV